MCFSFKTEIFEINKFDSKTLILTGLAPNQREVQNKHTDKKKLRVHIHGRFQSAILQPNTFKTHILEGN
jgi:hypothetical protein